MIIYIAKDNQGLKFFEDKPDRVNFIIENEIIWQGYPIKKSIYNKYANIIYNKYKSIINNLTIYDNPIKISIERNNIKFLYYYINITFI